MLILELFESSSLEETRMEIEQLDCPEFHYEIGIYLYFTWIIMCFWLVGWLVE